MEAENSSILWSFSLIFSIAADFVVSSFLLWGLQKIASANASAS